MFSNMIGNIMSQVSDQWKLFDLDVLITLYFTPHYYLIKFVIDSTNTLLRKWYEFFYYTYNWPLTVPIRDITTLCIALTFLLIRIQDATLLEIPRFLFVTIIEPLFISNVLIFLYSFKLLRIIGRILLGGVPVTANIMFSLF